MVAQPANSININSSAGVVSWDGVKTISTSSVNQYAIIVGSASQGIANISPSVTVGIPLISNGGSANPSFSTAVVAGGGTGVTTMTTAYAPVCAGTTATGVLQVASTGLSTSGYVLTSNGAGALPSFQATTGSGFTKVINQVFVYTGGSQTYTPTTNMKYCQIEVVSGGGGGGGWSSSGISVVRAGGGGGGGGYARGIFTAATIGASQIVTINNGGVGSTTVNVAGGTGGSVSVGALISATGGIGGIGGTTYNTMNGGAGGAGTGGSFQTTGTPGMNGLFVGTSLAYSGNGGSSFFGGGAIGLTFVTPGNVLPGNNALSYGGGGGGGCVLVTSAASAGGNGMNGIVIITEYI